MSGRRVRYRTPGHCEPVTDVTGVAISIFRRIQPQIRWRFPHQCAHWFGMTVLFGARTSLFKFQFVCLLNKTDIHIFFCVIVVSKRQKREGPRTSSGKQMKLWDLFFIKSESVSFSLSAVSARFALSSGFLYHAAEKLGSMAAILKPSH